MTKLHITLSLALAIATVSMQGCIWVNNSSAASPADAQTQADAAPTPQAPEDQAQNGATAVIAPMPQEKEQAPTAAEQVEKTDLPSVKDIVPPVCQKTGTRSEGWYRGDKLLTHAPCEGKTPECKMSGTRSEGWYSGDELIEYDQCDGKLPSEE